MSPGGGKSPSGILRKGSGSGQRHNGYQSGGHTRFLFGFHPDPDERMVDQALSALRKLLNEFQTIDPSACLISWLESDRACKVVQVDNFPRKRSEILPYCDSFRVGYPAAGKRWYVSICLSHEETTSASLLVDLEEAIKSDDWFLIMCPIQSDKRTVDVGWFAYSMKEYTSVDFRDALSEMIGIPKQVFAVQWQKPKEGYDALYAMTVKAAEGYHLVLTAALGAIYSSRSDKWPWGIRMRFVPYSHTLKTKNIAVENLKSAQIKFLQLFVAVPLDNLRVSLDSQVMLCTKQGELKLSVREALMRISGPAKKPSPHSSPAKGVFHGVVEYNDQRGRRVYLIPYPESQVHTSVGWMTVTYPFTILSHFYSRESITPLFVSHQIESEAGTVYDEAKDSIKNPTTMDLEECMRKDAQVFSFDLTLVDTDQAQQDKKRRHDGQLIRRLDETSIGTVRGEPNSSVAGSSKVGTRPPS